MTLEANVFPVLMCIQFEYFTTYPHPNVYELGHRSNKRNFAAACAQLKQYKNCKRSLSGFCLGLPFLFIIAITSAGSNQMPYIHRNVTKHLAMSYNSK